jgi:two-component system LytT family response regulator
MTSEAPIRVIVVDDEAPARRKILRLLSAEHGFDVVADADSGEAAIRAIAKHQPDLVFLDVQMPGMDGFGVVDAIAGPRMPRIVFVTAHDKYAVRAFQVHAFDYLLKPFDAERFQDALLRAREQHRQKPDGFDARLRHMLEEWQRERAYPERLLVQEGERSFFVPTRDVVWIEAERNYVLLHCAAKNHIVRSTLDGMEQSLDPKHFVRLNRSALVCVDAIKELRSWFHGEYNVVLRDGTELRWSRRYVTRRPDLLKGFS